MDARRKIVRDLEALGMPVDEVDVITPKFSKRYHGFYAIKYDGMKIEKPRVYVYLYDDDKCRNRYSYDFLLDTAIHEMCHHMQWRNPEFVRLKGVMHDDEFYRMYNYYIYKAQIMELMRCDYEPNTVPETEAA